MFSDFHFLESITPAQLDDYLLRGWYRIGQSIFTTSSVPHGLGQRPVFWLRYPIAKVTLRRRQKTLLRRAQQFQITFKPFEFTEELEELYGRYRANVEFDASPTARSFLVDPAPAFGERKIVFQSMAIEIRDQGKLIALGVFDYGETSLAGILNVYDPDYARFSLGRCLILLKMQHTLETGRTYFYPGYIAYGYSKFDYKLFADPLAAELYDPMAREWLPYSEDLIESLAMRPLRVNFETSYPITIVIGR